MSDRGGRRSIWTMSADGGIPERLVKAQVVDRLVWSGRPRIVFAMTVDDIPTLHMVSVADRTIQGSDSGPGGHPIRDCGRHPRLSGAVPGQRKQPNVNRVAFVGQG